MKIAYATFVLALVLLGCKGREPGEQIIFPAKVFYDSAQTVGDGMVYIAGALTGEDIGYKNNTRGVACYKDRMECLTYSVEQIGPNQIGYLDMPMNYPVIKWGPDEIVASGRDSGGN